MNSRGNSVCVKCLVLVLVGFIPFMCVGASAQPPRARLKLSYSDVRHLGEDCSRLDSCGYRRTSGSRGLDDPQKQNCQCDYKCDSYDDCCIDAPSFDDVPTPDASSSWQCYELRQFGGVYMRSSCSLALGNQELIDLCEKSNSKNLSDPMGTMPVTDSVSGLTYRNFYCGMCNENEGELILWTPRLECPTLTIYNSSRKNLTQEYVFQNLVFDGTNWGVYLDGDNGSLFFHDCSIDPVMPQLLESKIRLCKGQSVSECAEDWHDEDVRAKCEAYTGLRYFYGDSYRNVHCALCNHVNVSHLRCQPLDHRELIFRTFERRAFSLLLDVNEQSGKYVGFVQRCDEDELFDPFYKICRRIACLPGSTRRAGKCVPVRSQTTPEPTVSTDGSLPNATAVLEANDTETNTNVTTETDENVTVVTENSTNLHVGTILRTNHTIGDSEEESPMEKLKNCSLISLMARDYVVFQNQTIYVPEYDRLYEPTTYFAVDGSVLLCSPFEEEQAKFSPTMGYVTTVGLGISMICLFLHFLTFCIVPDLQNLSGKNLLSHCIALFFAYCFFIAGLGQLQAELCTATAFLTVYFFQASFFWMSILAFDVWRTLKMATTELRVSSGKQQKRFLLYSLYSWCCPMVLLGLIALAEYTDVFPEEYRPGFTPPKCWFRHKRALLCFFAAPLFAVILSNIILFASSAKMIILTTQTTVKQQNPSQKRNFKLYLRLFILMGLTWVVGFVAGWVDMELLWHVFIVFNTLQGCFIFLSFSCSTKVLTYLRDRASKCRKTTEFRSSTSQSTSQSGCHTNSTTALTNVSFKPTDKLWVAK